MTLIIFNKDHLYTDNKTSVLEKSSGKLRPPFNRDKKIIVSEKCYWAGAITTTGISHSQYFLNNLFNLVLNIMTKEEKVDLAKCIVKTDLSLFFNDKEVINFSAILMLKNKCFVFSNDINSSSLNSKNSIQIKEILSDDALCMGSSERIAYSMLHSGVFSIQEIFEHCSRYDFFTSPTFDSLAQSKLKPINLKNKILLTQAQLVPNYEIQN